MKDVPDSTEFARTAPLNDALRRVFIIFGRIFVSSMFAYSLASYIRCQHTRIFVRSASLKDVPDSTEFARTAPLNNALRRVFIIFFVYSLAAYSYIR